MYVISVNVRGRRFRQSTRAWTLKEARAIYRRFIVDPDGFRLVAPPPDPAQQPIHLDEALVKGFLDFSRRKGNTGDWVSEQRVHLLALKDGLGKQDLRGLPLQTLLPLVKGNAHRIAVLKALYSWLRKVEHRLTPAEDPTHGTLTVPQRRVGQRRVADKSVPRARVDAVLACMSERWRALLHLQAGTGIHTTELLRFARAGWLEGYRGPQRATSVMVVPLHKNGDEHRVALDAGLDQAARAVRISGTFDPSGYHLEVRLACERAKVPPFTPGRMRHSVATWMVEAGADLASVSTFLGHRTLATTRAFYARFATPRNPALEVR
ncbi:MAG TPA: tyrosine-type recombinase/integrase [Myxococcaceae bacterium]|nr:tyrosine-type recombinase/integrase [Myxococcaceae bacterium]